MKITANFPLVMQCKLFEDVPASVTNSFLSESSLRHFDADTTVLQQGRLPEGICIIVAGKVEITYLSAEGHTSVIDHVSAPEIVGLVEAVAEQPCAATSVAFAQSTLVFCPPHVVKEGLLSPIMLRNFARIWAHMLLHDNDFKSVDIFYTAEQRICRYLSQFARGQSLFTRSQSYLANAVGCSRQTVNKEFGVLQDLGIIARTDAGIRVIDDDALHDRIRRIDDRNEA